MTVNRNWLGLPLDASAASEKARMLFPSGIGLQTPKAVHCFAKRRSPKVDR
jgi:hypothetical protein